MNCLEEFEEILWQIIEKDIISFKQKHAGNCENFYDDFFDPGREYHVSLAPYEKYKQRHADFILDLHAKLNIEFREKYSQNIKFYEWFARLNRVGLSYQDPQFPSEYLADTIDGFYLFVLPRIIFARQPKEIFRTHYQTFTADFLSEEASFIFYCKFENLFGDTYDLKLGQEMEVDIFSGILLPNFDDQSRIEKYCFYREVKRRCETAFSIDRTESKFTGHKSNAYYCAISRPKISKSKLSSRDYRNYYDFFRKITFLIRIVCNSITYFEIVGIRPVWQVQYNLPAVCQFPGHRLSRTIFYRTDINQGEKELIKRLWPNFESIHYESLFVSDFKYECCLRRSEIRPPTGYDEYEMFSNFDRILDLFQAIENILAVPRNRKGEFLKEKWPILIVPEKSKISERQSEANFIDEMWKLRNDYVHGDLDKLLAQVRAVTEKRSLRDKTHKLAYQFTRLMQFMIKHSQLIPGPGIRGKRDRCQLDAYCSQNQ